MPSLFDVASHFDDVACVDSYTGAALFNAQFSSFIESSPDGSTTQKRTLSLAPTLTIPARRCISFQGEHWIVGDGNVDMIYNTPTRRAYWMKKSFGLFTRYTPLQTLNGSAGISSHAGLKYLKDTVNGVSDSQYDPQWGFDFSQGEVANKGDYIKQGSTYYRVRVSYVDGSGFLHAVCDQLDAGCFVTVTKTSTGAYNPITDTYTSSATSVSALMMEPYKLYSYFTEADPRFTAGDKTLVTAAALVVGSTVTINSEPWKVQSSYPEIDAFASHIRRC